jgi:hypothetical protein
MKRVCGAHFAAPAVKPGFRLLAEVSRDTIVGLPRLGRMLALAEDPELAGLASFLERELQEALKRFEVADRAARDVRLYIDAHADLKPTVREITKNVRSFRALGVSQRETVIAQLVLAGYLEPVERAVTWGYVPGSYA